MVGRRGIKPIIESKGASIRIQSLGEPVKGFGKGGASM